MLAVLAPTAEETERERVALSVDMAAEDAAICDDPAAFMAATVFSLEAGRGETQRNGVKKRC